MNHVIIGILLIILGYLVRFKQWSWLIAGYNTSSKEEKAKYDKVALCTAVGNFMFIAGGIVFIASLGEFLEVGWIISLGWILFTAITIVFLVYANTGNRFKK